MRTERALGLVAAAARSPASRHLAMLSLSLVSACADAAPPSWAGTAVDSAGVSVVTSPAQGLWSERDRPTVERAFLVGGGGAAPGDELGDVIALALRGDGHLFALDRLAHVVREYDEAGAPTRTIGGPGEGPGEMSDGADGVWVEAGDTLAVADVSAQRVVRFGPEGQPVAPYPIPFTRGIAYRWRMDGTGRVIHRLVLFEQGGRSPSAEVVVARDASRTVSDTLLRLPVLESMTMGPAGPVLTILAPEAVWDSGPDGWLVSATTDRFEIRRHRPDGSLAVVIRRTGDTEALTRADAEAYREAFLRLWDGRMPPNMHQAMRANARFSDVLPAFASLRAGPAGTTWVERFRRPSLLGAAARALLDPERDTGSGTWDVFGRDGRYLGALTFAERFTPMLFSGTIVYGVLRDELDVQMIAAYRLIGFPGEESR